MSNNSAFRGKIGVTKPKKKGDGINVACIFPSWFHGCDDTNASESLLIEIEGKSVEIYDVYD